MDCHIAGDSIAVGLAWHFQECTVSAQSGIAAPAIIARARDAEVLIVSAGSNWPRSETLDDDLEQIRARTRGRVIWIAPIDAVASLKVRDAAMRHGDTVIYFEACDHVHPCSYGALADKVRPLIR